MLRLPKISIRKVLAFLMLFFIIVSFLSLPVRADIDDYRNNCSTTGISEDCLPPQISDIQVLVAKMLTTAWSLGAIAFFLILLYNGAIYLLGSWEDAEYILGASIKDVQKRMSQWGVGFFMFFLSYPLMNTILGGLVANTDCYSELREPGFTFFFPSVCNEIEIAVEPIETNILPNDVTITFGCTDATRSQCVNYCGTYYKNITSFPLVGSTGWILYCDCGNSSDKCLGIYDVTK